MLYALNKINQKACKDRWDNDQQHQLFPCPPGLSDCNFGHCRAGTKERCLELGQLPYDPQTGEDWPPGATCTEDKDCPDHHTCLEREGKKSCVLAKPYLEWREPTQDQPQGNCIYGNFAFRRWCEHPDQRRPSFEAGVTNVPPFKYDADTGRCKITPEYCAYMETDWNPAKEECDISALQWLGEFFLGKTIFRGIKGVGNVFSENFGGDGVHLYRAGQRMGLDWDEFQTTFPHGPPKGSRADKLLMMQQRFDSKPSRA